MIDACIAGVTRVDDWLKRFQNLHIFPRANRYANEAKTAFGVVSLFYFCFSYFAR